MFCMRNISSSPSSMNLVNRSRPFTLAKFSVARLVQGVLEVRGLQPLQPLMVGPGSASADVHGRSTRLLGR